MGGVNPLEIEKRQIEEAKRDPERFLVLYDKYVDQIYRYIARRTGSDKDSAHDILSQTFLDALSHIKDYTHQGFPFSSWLYRIAHNNIIKWYKKSDQTRYDPIEEARKVSDPNENILQKVDNGILQEQVQDMMNRLEPEEQEIIRLKFFENVSNIEIADILGLSVTNVGVKVYRTLKKAKSLLPSKNELKKLS
jgi:RNA polymerase sigma-70 factor (ECF subfamily)